MENKMNNGSKKHMFAAFASLFTSVGTLLCCALPALFVTIGAGATLASLVSSAPWLVALSKYKIWTFTISGLMILIAGLFRFISRNRPCPIDHDQAKLCGSFRKVGSIVYWLSVAVWLVGFFFAFVAVHLFY